MILTAPFVLVLGTMTLDIRQLFRCSSAWVWLERCRIGRARTRVTWIGPGFSILERRPTVFLLTSMLQLLTAVLAIRIACLATTLTTPSVVVSGARLHALIRMPVIWQHIGLCRWHSPP